MRRILLLGGAAIVLAGAYLALRPRVEAGLTTAAIDAALGQLPPHLAARHGAVHPTPSGATVEDFALLRDGGVVLTAARVEIADVAGLRPGGVERIGRLDLRDVTVTPRVFHADRVRVEGLEAARWQAVLAPDASSGGAAWPDRRPLLGRLTVEHATLHGGPGQNGSVLDGGFDRLTLAGVAGLPLLPAAAGIPPPPGASAQAGEAAGSALTPEARRARAKALLRWAVGEASLDGVSFAANDGGAARIGRIALTGWDGGRLAGWWLDKLSISGRDGVSVMLDRVGLDGLDATGMLTALADMPPLPPGGNSPAWQAELQRRLLQGAQPKLDRSLLAGLRVTGVPQLRRFDWAKAELTSAPQSATTRSNDTTLEGLVIELAPDGLPPPIESSLTAFGLRRFAITGGSHGRVNADRSGAIDDSHLTIEGLGTLRLAYAVGTPGDPLPADPKDPASLFNNMVLGPGHVTWEDASLTARLFHLAALRTGRTEAELTQGVEAAAAGLAVLIPDQPDAAAQIGAFLRGRRRLSISIAPAPPIRVADLRALPLPERAGRLKLRIAGN